MILPPPFILSSKTEYNSLHQLPNLLILAISLAILPSLSSTSTPRKLLVLTSLSAIFTNSLWIVLNTTHANPVVSFGSATVAVFLTLQAGDLLYFSWTPSKQRPNAPARACLQDGVESIGSTRTNAPQDVNHIHDSVNDTQFKPCAKNRATTTLSGEKILGQEDVAVEIPFYRTYTTAGWSSCVSQYSSATTFLQKLNWSFNLISCVRGVGWNIEFSSLRVERLSLNYTLYQFYKMTIMKLMVVYLSLDILKHYMVYDKYFEYGASALPKSSYSFTYGDGDSHDLIHRMGGLVLNLGLMWWRSLLGGYAVLVVVSGVYYITALIAVLTGHSGCNEWPEPFMFGALGTVEGWTIAGFWGRFWHQFFRRGFVGPTRAKVFRDIPILQLTIPFFCSSLLHCSGAYVHANLGIHSFVFFNLQPWGILLQAYLFNLRPSATKSSIRSSNTKREMANGSATTIISINLLVDNEVSSKRILSKAEPQQPKLSDRPCSQIFHDNDGNIGPSSMSSVKKTLLVVSSIAWILTTSSGYIEEYCRSGLFRIEPVPFSVLSLMGFRGKFWRW